MRDSGDALIATLDVGPGMDVLDLGCGDGTTALPSARRGARVLGVDIASNLVAAGIRRAREAGLDNLHFQQGDASSLDDLSDGRFDLVVSMFGAMFAPRPFDTAREMVRVTRPGGRIRSEEQPSELQTLMRISYAVFCLTKKNISTHNH